MIDKIVANIKSLGGTMEEAARSAFEIRNSLRTKARDLMSNREKAAEFARDNANLTWEQVMEKYKGDYETIIAGSKRSRPSVNAEIERRRAAGER